VIAVRPALARPTKRGLAVPFSSELPLLPYVLYIRRREVMLNLLTIFKTETKDEHRNTHIRRVRVLQSSGHINIEAMTIGPRGGMALGLPGFSAEEFTLIMWRHKEVMSRDPKTTIPSNFYYPGE
jgi:hypothetical protein